MSLLKRIFTWWNGYTIGTSLFTSRYGEKVGEDAFGNLYYQTADGARRWVIYKGEVEASKVPVDWHGWLHHTFALPPSKAPLPRHGWEKPHKPNLTGAEAAYRPPGSLSAPGARPAPVSGYQAWTPE